MTDLREAAQMALDALEYPGPSWPDARQKAAEALRAALATAPPQRDFKFNTIEEAMQPMPPAPERPQLTDNETLFANAFTALVRAGYGKEAEVVLKCKPKWQGMTRKQLLQIWGNPENFNDPMRFARAIEAKLREKNHG